MAFNFIQRKCTIKRRWRETTKSWWSLGKKKYFKALVQLGHLRIKDVFVGNISKNYTKIGYSNQHHDNLFSLFIYLFFFFKSFVVLVLVLEKLQSKLIFIGWSCEAVIFYNIFLSFPVLLIIQKLVTHWILNRPIWTGCPHMHLNFLLLTILEDKRGTFNDQYAVTT